MDLQSAPVPSGLFRQHHSYWVLAYERAACLDWVKPLNWISHPGIKLTHHWIGVIRVPF